MCIYAKAHSDVFTVSRPQVWAILPPVPALSLQTNKIIPTSIYGAPNTCPPQGIWKSSGLANLERALGEDGTRGRRVALHVMSVLKITLVLL